MTRMEVQGVLTCSLTNPPPENCNEDPLLQELRVLFRIVEDRDLRVTVLHVSPELFHALRKRDGHFAPSAEEGEGSLWGARVATIREVDPYGTPPHRVSLVSVRSDPVQVFGRGLPMPPPISSVWDRLEEDDA